MTRSRALAVVVLALVASGVTLAALELALRVTGVETASYHAIGGFTVYDPALGWRLAPRRDLLFRGSTFAVRVAQNAEGLRGRYYPQTREPGRRRILVLGDSFVWCWGVEQAECFTERLEAAMPGTDVINAGVPAYSTAQEMLLYENDVRRYRPDLVLLVFVPNDPVENVRGWGPRFRLDGGRLVATNVPVPRRKSVVGEWLQARSRLYAEIVYRLAVARESLRYASAGHRALAPSAASAGVATEYVPAAPPRTSPAWAVTAALLDRLAADVARDGARFAVASEAMPHDMAVWLQAGLAARGIPYVDLAPALAAARPGERVRLSPDPHLAPAGQRIVADALRAFIEREGLLPAARDDGGS